MPTISMMTTIFLILLAGSTGNSATPLSVYQGGASAGVVYAPTENLRNESEQFLKLTWIHRMYISPRLDMTGEMSWYLPGTNPAADLGLDYFILGQKIRPYAGVGVGAHYFSRSDSFGKNIGASATARAGVHFKLSSRLDMYLAIPYTLVLNHHRDQVVGLQIGFTFSDGLRHVIKLNPEDL